MYAEHLLADAHMSQRHREAARRRSTTRARRDGQRPARRVPTVVLGQLLVRTGERLSGASPGARHG